MEINFQGTIDRFTLRKAIALMSTPPLWQVILRVALAMLIVATLATLVYSKLTGETLTAGRVIRVLIQDLFLGYFVVQPYFASRALFNRLSRGNQGVRGSITPLGIYYHVGETGQRIEYPWNGFHYVFKTADLTVLATADSRISILPRSFFEQEQDWNHFCQYVESRVKPVK